MRVVVEAPAGRTMREHAAAAYPQECCGALVGRAAADARIVRAAWPVENASEIDRAHRYAIAPSSYLEVERRANAEGVTLLGFYHSHPDAPARPSERDLLQALPRVDYIIVSVVRATPSDITCWRLRDDRVAFAPEEIEWRPES